jgi:hypothetical protein
MNTTQTNRPWHSFPYVWMMILIPFSAVIMGVIMLSLAIESSSGLVVDDYYKQGKEINRVLARDEMASSMGLEARLTLDSDTGKLQVKVNSTEGAILADQLELHFFHSTREGKDQSRTLHRADGNTYTARIEQLPAGRWNLQISTESWRLTGSMKTPGNHISQLTPAVL